MTGRMCRALWGTERRGSIEHVDVKNLHAWVKPLSPVEVCSATDFLPVMMSSPPPLMPQEDKRDMLHSVYRVGNMDETIAYYKKHFGAKLLRYRDIPEVRLCPGVSPGFITVTPHCCC